ncbi:MAG: ABC transporter substrate-binding protein [Bacteroidia bacterium]|nr:ABC transporter substrate-binding protein [Bacteroidia bacterium]
MACVLGITLFTSCGKPEKSVDNPEVFHMNLSEGLNTLDPAFARSRGRIWMTAQLFNGLVALDSALNVVPSISKKWDISPDARTYTFILRDSVFFHENSVFGNSGKRKVVAEDFRYSFTRICDPKTASTGKWIFGGKIFGLEDFVEGNSDKVAGFRALDDTTFQIVLTKPFPAFLSLLAMPYAYVVPKEAVNHYGEDFQVNPVGTGPFQFYRWEEGNFLILHKNKDYFEDKNGEQLPYLNAVKVSFIPSRLSAFIEFVQGSLDFIGDLDNSYKDEVLKLDGSIREDYSQRFQFLLAPQLNTEYLGFQVDGSLEVAKGHPLLDVRVRRAFNLAIDRQKISSYLLNGMGYPANSGFVPYGMPGFSEEKVPGFNFNPDSAKKLLAEAGYPGGEGLGEITLNATQEYATIMAFVQKSLENIGVDVNIQNLQSGALRREIYGSRVNFWRASWIADYPDGENYLGLFYSKNHSPSGPNTTHFSSEAFDKLYEKALTVTDDSSRQGIYQQMDRLMLEQAPIIPLYYDRSFRMLQNEWTGLSSNPMNHLFLKEVRRK